MLQKWQCNPSPCWAGGVVKYYKMKLRKHLLNWGFMWGLSTDQFCNKTIFLNAGLGLACQCKLSRMLCKNIERWYFKMSTIGHFQTLTAQSFPQNTSLRLHIHQCNNHPTGTKVHSVEVPWALAWCCNYQQIGQTGEEIGMLTLPKQDQDTMEMSYYIQKINWSGEKYGGCDGGAKHIYGRLCYKG